MKKLFALLSAFTFVLTSCSSDDSNDAASGQLLTKLVETYENGDVETVTFQYSGNKILKRTSDYAFRDETIFTYTGDLITKEEYFFDDDAGYSFYEVINYEYDATNRLIKSSRTATSLAEEDVFTYNSNGTISFTTTSTISSPSTIVATGVIYLNGDQPYKKEITFDPGTAMENNAVEEGTFDDKINPFMNITGYSKMAIACPTYNYSLEGTVNNYLTYKRDNVLWDSSTYTYNSNNMPLTETYTDVEGNGDENSTLQYFYN